MNFKPSKRQKAVISAAEKGESILINAVAGSGKTTTLKMIIDALPKDKSILLMAFNKSIVKELQSKIKSPNVEIKTSHGLGYSIMREKLRYLKIDKFKSKSIVNQKCQEWGWNSEDVSEIRADLINNTVKLVNFGKLFLAKSAGDLCSLAVKYGMELIEDECGKAFEVLEIENRVTKNEIDFADMIYFPARFPERYKFPKYDVVLVDECQDLSICQRTISNLVCKNEGQLIYVGDKLQSIYSFAGADAESFDEISKIENRNITCLPLDICYRCGSDIIKEAQHYNPIIQAFEKNDTGKVDYEASINDVSYEDLVLCRANMPLLKLCYSYIAQGKAAYIKGKDIGENLVNFIKRSKKTTYLKFSKYRDTKLKMVYGKVRAQNPFMEHSDIIESMSYSLQKDKFDIIDLIVEEKCFKKMEDVINEIRNIFKNAGNGITLSTVHKAKGLEADRVFIVDYQLFDKFAARANRMKVKHQEDNLRYVAITRAKKYFGYVTDWSAYSKC